MTEFMGSGADPDLFTYTPLLDDTLLHLAVLEQNADMGPMHAWRARCVALLAGFDDDLLSLAVTPAQARSLRLSHAVLLDEATLASCSAQMRKEWEAASLCQVELGEPGAVQEVLADIDVVASESRVGAGWLHWYVRLFAAGLLRRRSDTAWRCRRLNDRLRLMWPAADEVIDSE